MQKNVGREFKKVNKSQPNWLTWDASDFNIYIYGGVGFDSQ